MRIFVISLKGDSRRKKISKHLLGLGINFEFFDAVDGSNLNINHKKMIDVEATFKNISRGLSDGEYACALSHAFLYKKIISEQIANSIVLEDDVLTTIDLKVMIDACILEDSKFDLVLLCYLGAWRKKCSYKSFFNEYRSFRLWNSPLRTAAYYINNKAAKNLYRAAIPISAAADWPTGSFHGLSTAGIEPQVVCHPEESVVSSNLSQERESIEATFKKERIKAVQKKKSSSFLGKSKITWRLSRRMKKFFMFCFIPKNKNTKLPLLWLKLLGSLVIDK